LGAGSALGAVEAVAGEEDEEEEDEEDWSFPAEAAPERASLRQVSGKAKIFVGDKARRREVLNEGCRTDRLRVGARSRAALLLIEAMGVGR